MDVGGNDQRSRLIRWQKLPPHDQPTERFRRISACVLVVSNLPSTSLVPADKRFVYVLKNADPDPCFYVGLTSDVNARTDDHNTGRCPHTASRRPWRRHVMIEFQDENSAIRFERYLKSGSGRAFAKRHFES